MLKVEIGDITKEKVGAIVCDANKDLLSGGEVFKAVQKAAGPELSEACQALGGCEFGEAKITKGYSLPAKHIIHTVAPLWKGGGENEENQLAICYQSCLELADKEKIKSLVFPAISTGEYKFPKEKAARIAISSVRYYMDQERNNIRKITFVLYKQEDFDVYKYLWDTV